MTYRPADPCQADAACAEPATVLVLAATGFAGAPYLVTCAEHVATGRKAIGRDTTAILHTYGLVPAS